MRRVHSTHFPLLSPLLLPSRRCVTKRSFAGTVYFRLITAIRAGKPAEDIRTIFQENAQNDELIRPKIYETTQLFLPSVPGEFLW